jgi:hypothetical protein
VSRRAIIGKTDAGEIVPAPCCDIFNKQRGLPMTRILQAALIGAAAIAFAVGAPASVPAQTRPAVTTLGPNFPNSEIFIGNSFFNYGK